ncbi:quinate 5-dehydrogenase [Eubacterium sulci ATCC 35585]|jgi:potassium uptake protein trkA|nr:quinate 5-dehydrogenase [Eubacterium sulci ATCC 35585]EUC77925.1 Trk system potassium uptake protein TrkA, N-terminal domain protein [Eubacterium sulci ATCC 35585]
MNIAIIGGGKLGIKVCEALVGGDYSITIVDTNDALLDRLSQQFDVMTVNEDARDINVLKEIGINKFQYVLVATGRDETNLVIGGFAKKLGCHRVIVRVRDPEYMKHFEFIRTSMGIDYIVNPDFAITMEIYKYLSEKYTLNNGVFTSGRIALIEFKAKRKKELIGLKMPDVRRLMPDMLIAAISRNGKVIIPHGNDEIREDDAVYVVGEKNEIMELNKKVHVKGKYTDLQKVMIIGGGKTGYYLAQRLADFGASVKLVEQSKERCQYLSTRIPNVMILHGDGTDMDMLEEENIDEMDAFVTATGYDEQNLLLALTAKQKGIEDVISKISRESYSGLIEEMGVDMVLNPLDITAAYIFSIIQGEKRVISSMLVQGQAEIIEVVATPGMKMVGDTLQNLNLPKGVLIASIYRQGEVIIPDGNARIKDGDRVIMFSLLSDIADLEKLMKIR